MKISKVSVYRTSVNYKGGAYQWGRGNVVKGAYSTIIVIDTDAGISGCGEFCAAGNNYIEAHSEGAEAAARILGPLLIGHDPRQVGYIERLMDHELRGHEYAKAPFDSACWDILGKATGQPVWMLLGGKLTEASPLFRSVPQTEPEKLEGAIDKYRQEGYRNFQIKVGSNWKKDIEQILTAAPLIRRGEQALADANQGWHLSEAVEIIRATRDVDYILEQPCRTYEECLSLRRILDRPLKLDECITDMRSAQRVVEDRAAEYVCLKLAKQGGISKTRRMRDFLVDNRISIVVDDTWGGEIAATVVAHIAASTPEEFLDSASDLHNYQERAIGKPGPETKDGNLFVSSRPGLGVEPDYDVIGAPVAVYGG
nr:mandelate racemase/muconate lactonizing enzyme family protein [Mesorhizobium sp. WSM4875]